MKTLILTLFLVLVSTVTTVHAQEKFEYKLLHVKIGIGTEAVEKALNAEGKNGWEMVDVYARGMLFTFFLQRKIQ